MNDTLGAELIAARACSAARGGDLDGAERLLRDLDATADPSAAHLDLLARVHAQRGNIADADECWARVQASDPDNPAAAAGRKLISEISAGRRRARPVLRSGRVGLIAACAVVVGAAIWVGGLIADGVASPAGLGPGGDIAAARSQTRRADALAQQLAALQAEHANEVARHAADRRTRPAPGTSRCAGRQATRRRPGGIRPGPVSP
ncbi:MAG TPA: hypothetical protein VIY28_16825 [Pseudonocardiaceae bacterium]